MLLKILNSFLLKETTLFNNVTVKPILLRNLSMAYGECELIDKWKSKFEEEKVPEVDASLENILDHVLDNEKKKVFCWLDEFFSFFFFCGKCPLAEWCKPECNPQNMKMIIQLIDVVCVSLYFSGAEN